jgi:carotenoid cleavage dioxygenase-like enzyme
LFPSSEDDGLIVASVTDVRDDVKDFLLFIDARNMTEVARASFDEQIPLSSHACLVKL